ncbi:MAG: hypothetical protein AAFV45_07305 [Pseudomonadota bacterium]
MSFDFGDHGDFDKNGHDRRSEISSIRAQSVRTVGLVYCCLALGCAAAALIFQHGGLGMGLPSGDAQTVSSAFAAIGSINLVLLTVWEKAFGASTD